MDVDMKTVSYHMYEYCIYLKGIWIIEYKVLV